MSAEQYLRFGKIGTKLKKSAKVRGPHLPFTDGDYKLEFTGGVGKMAASLLPKTDWRRPTVMPDLSGAHGISVDIESFDPELHSKGPGFVRKNAEIIGVGVSARWTNGERFKGYYPIRHRAGAEDNFDEKRVFDWLSSREGLNNDRPKIGANLPYDLEGFAVDGGFKVSGPIFDIQNAEGILDEESARATCEEHRGFALEKLGWKYVGRGKNEAALKAIQAALGKKNVKGSMRDLPPASGPGKYGEDDTELAFDVWDCQEPIIRRENLDAIWKLECDLLPVLLEMRLRGVRVDLERAEIASREMQSELGKELDILQAVAGRKVDPWKNDSLVQLCEAIDVPFMRTAAGNPSFTAPWLKDQKHPALQKILFIRRLENMERNFIRGVIMGANVNGRLHTQFHQLRRSTDEEEDGEEGTRSGRLSSANPNLQQVPKRDKRFGPLIRSMFVPESGERWFRGDYSGQEFRLLAHYAARAAMAGMLSEKATAAAMALMREYNANPGLDYHGKIAQMTGLDRDSVAKPLNLMLVYGAGRRKVAVSTKWITESQFRDREFKLPSEVNQFFDIYHEGVPFVQELLKSTDRLASTRGFTVTIRGRRRHFELYVPKRSDDGWGDPLPLQMARDHWGADVVLVRADTRKALNSIIQGSGADMTKKALLDLYKAGFLPTLTVHDEIDASIKNPGDAKLIHDCMRDAVKCLVPILADVGVGTDWAQADSKEAKALGELCLSGAGGWS